MSTRLVVGLFAAALGLGLFVSAGSTGLLYLPLFLAAVAPGLPLGITILGRYHPGAWIVGALLGYGLTQLTLWGVIAAGLASPLAFVIAWVALCAGTTAIARIGPGGPVIAAPAWSSGDVRALILVLLFVPVLIGLPYRNLGRADAEGNRYYRAYFTADFLWHSALAGELAKFSLPPRNPYLAPRSMNYYWTYFLLPSTVAETAPAVLAPLQDAQADLKANALLVGVLMVGVLFVLVRSAVANPGPAAIAVLLALLAASAEGLYAIIDLWSRGRPFAELLDTNVDAITAWSFGGLRVDNMPRSLWYTPQHTTSIALGLAALTLAVLGGAGAPLRAALVSGLALGLATTMNPLIGGVCSLIYGICIAVDAVSRPRWITALVRHASAALFVVLAVAWAATSRVVDGAGSALDIGFSGFSRNSPFVTLLLSLGPVLVPALFGLIAVRTDIAKRSIVVATSGLVAGLFLLYFVRVSEASWVGFRAGQILLVTIPILLARTLDWLPRPSGSALAALILLIGLPTTVIDTWNAQDIWNRRPGPGFRWTLWTTPDQQQAFEWIKRHTPPKSIVQMEPMVRGREHWTLIPSFAARRMAAGLPISLLPLPDYPERSARVKRLFETVDPAEASAVAMQLRIDYLYVDQDDVAAYPEGTAKFDASPRYFEPVFRNGTVRVYRVV